MSGRRGFAAAIAVAAAAALCWRLWPAPPGAAPAPAGARAADSRSAPPRALLLITIDTLRADHVGAYGHAAARTPALDGVARRGVRFARAYAPAPITLVSHASLLTGLNPPGHGARHNGLHVDSRVRTLATVLGARGFATGAFVSAFPLDRRFGLARGFQVYDDEMPLGAVGRQNERAGAETVGRAIEWLAPHLGEPFFLWVHLFEPHAPYGDGSPGSRARPALARYDDEVAEADRQVGRLLDALGPARSTSLVVVAGDHGEAFGEHGEVTHSLFVYDTTLHVPWLMAGPGVPRGVVEDEAVALVDVAPTVLGLLAAERLDTDGVDLGRRLASMGATRVSAPRALYAESLAPWLDFGWSPLRSVREGRWRYIDAPRHELYDLAQDPGESRDQASGAPDDARRLAARAAAMGPWRLDASTAPAADADREAASRLAGLGYVTPERAAPSGRLPDPKDRREVAARLADLVSGELSAPDVVPALTAVLAQDPGNLQAHLRLGVALAGRADCGAAEPHLRRAIAGRVPGADAYLSLALCLRARRDAAGARRALEDAARVDPGNPLVTANIGLLAFDEGRLPDAIAALGAALAGDPDLHQARFVLARALARSGQQAAAREQADALLARLPPSAPQRPEVERLLAALR